jgi:ubiquinone/menaquinone biosynthesis C-methylase UbiE
MLSRVRRALGAQLRRPTGLAGRAVSRLLSPLNGDSNALAIDALGIEDNDRILELGFGPADALCSIAQRWPAVHMVGLDHSPAMLAHASRRLRAPLNNGVLTLLQGRFDALPFGDKIFDKLLAVHVAYFFVPAGTELKEAYRVLREGGRIVLLVTAKAAMTRWGFDSIGSHRLLDRKDIVDDLTRAGFEPRGITVATVPLRFGVKALLATAEKAER